MRFELGKERIPVEGVIEIFASQNIVEFLTSADYERLLVKLQLGSSLELRVAQGSFPAPEGTDRQSIVVGQLSCGLAGHWRMASRCNDVDAFGFLRS